MQLVRKVERLHSQHGTLNSEPLQAPSAKVLDDDLHSQAATIPQQQPRQYIDAPAHVSVSETATPRKAKRQQRTAKSNPNTPRSDRKTKPVAGHPETMVDITTPQRPEIVEREQQQRDRSTQQPQSSTPRTHAQQQPRNSPFKGPMRSGEPPSEQRSQTRPGSQQRQQLPPSPRSQTGPAYRPQTAPMPQQFRPATGRPQTGPMPHAPMPGPPCGPWWPHHMGHPPPLPVWPADPRLVPPNYYGLQPPPGWLQPQLHYHGMFINLVSASLNSLHAHMPGSSCQFPVHMRDARY